MSKPPIKNLRWYVAGMLSLATTLNYLDRQTLSVLAQTIKQDLRLTDVQYSHITTAFLISYTVMYAVSGRLIDLMGTARGFTVFVSGWSVANMLHALARTALQFSVFRFLLGATEPANFPAGVKAVSEWFPMKERALAVGIFNSGTALGAMLAMPVVSLIAWAWGWPMAFVVTGGLGFIWVAVWVPFYRLPRQHERLSAAERELILSGTQAPDGRPSEAGRGQQDREDEGQVPLLQLLEMKETWGCVMVRFLTDPISYFLTFWIPLYLQKERGFTLTHLAKYAWLPYAAYFLGHLASGAIPRWLVSRGWSLNRARKATILTDACLIPVCCLLVTRVHSPAAALVLLMGMMFGHSAFGNITFPAEVFPNRAVGTVSGLGGCLGGVAGAASQPAIGWVVQNLSFAPVFAVCSGAYLLAFLMVQVLIGELGRIRQIHPRASL
jgi:ACS family hexuronate transporter-like MFS transporter